MFPRAIQQASKPKQVAYSLFLPIALFIWILRNVFGWPSEFKFVENYTAVFMQTEAVKYFFNSFLITLPAVAISIALACLAGYALAIYRFRGFIIRLPANSFFTRRSKLGFALCSCAILLRHCLLI